MDMKTSGGRAANPDSLLKRGLPSLDEMDAFVEDRFAGHEVAVALADGDKLLGLWTRETIDSGSARATYPLRSSTSAR
jgi:hypothetical protein